MKEVYAILMLLISLSSAKGQHRVHGVVLDNETKPIQGATVSAKGTGRTTTTSEDGRFSIDSPSEQGDLMIVCHGYWGVDTVFSLADLPLKIVLQPLKNSIDEVEVVHTGYQQLPKERSTGSFVKISEEMLNQRVGSSLIDRLEGYSPGLQFENRSGNKDLHIRGLSTFNLTMTSPLIVVDNFPYEGDLNNINPADIESVTLLRDAAATSIWGARAGNGVLVITRKKAKQTNLTVGYQIGTKLSEKKQIEKNPVMSSKDFVEVERYLFGKGFYDGLLDPLTNKQTIVSPVVHMLDRHRNGQVSDEDLASFVTSLEHVDYRKQMKEYLFKKPALVQQSITLGSGSERFAYRTSVGYDYSISDIVHTRSSRMTVSQNLAFALMKNVHLDFSLDITSSRNRFPSSIGGYPIRPGGGRSELYPYANLVDSKGDYLTIPRGFNPYYLDLIASPALMDWSYSPLQDIEKGMIGDRLQHVYSGVNLKYDIRKGITASIFYGNEQQRSDRETLYKEDSYFVRNLVNTFTQVDGDNYSYPIPRGAIMDLGHNRMISHRGRAMLNVDRSIRDVHFVNAVVGFDISARKTNNNGNRYYGLDERLLTTVPVDLDALFATFDRLQGTQRIPDGSSLTELNNRFVSFYGNASYSLFNRYTVTGSARKDASNVFGVNTNNLWNPLWSVGLSWKILEEEWVSTLGWLQELNLRSTYGHSGNAGGIATMLPVIAYLSYTPDWITNYPRAQVRSLPNANLRWEDVGMFNIGLDFRVLNGRLSGSIEYFSKRSSDLLADDLIDPTMGFTSMTRNVGEMNGKGFDIMLNGRLSADNFSWTGNFNLSKSENKIVRYYGSSTNASYYTQNAGTAMRPLEGYSPYPVFAYRFAGLDPETGDPLGYFNQEISTDYRSIMRDSVQNLKYYGSSMSPLFGSFRNAFKWKNIELSCLISFKFGAYKQKQTIRYNDLFNSWVSHSDYEKRWQKPGDEGMTTVPSLIYPANSNRDDFYAYSEPNIFNASHIRLQDVRVSYRFGLPFRERKSHLNVALIANQLGMLWTSNSEGFDPDSFPVPMARNYSINVSWNY